MKLTQSKTKTKKQIVKLGTGSGFGIHHWMGVVECPKRQMLIREHPKIENVTFAMLVGTCGHALLAEHFRGNILDLDNVKFEPEVSQNIQFNAISAIRKWLETHSDPDMFGKPIHVEKYFSFEEEGRDVLGIPYTMSADLITEPTKEILENLARRFHMPHEFKPGLYLTDHKFHKSWWNKDPDNYNFSLQATGYQLGVYWETGVRPEGMFFHHIVWGGKTQQVFVSFSPFPNEARQKAFINFLMGAREIEKHLPNWANGAKCRWPQICPFMENGICEGY